MGEAKRKRDSRFNATDARALLHEARLARGLPLTDRDQRGIFRLRFVEFKDLSLLSLFSQSGNKEARAMWNAVDTLSYEIERGNSPPCLMCPARFYAPWDVAAFTCFFADKDKPKLGIGHLVCDSCWSKMPADQRESIIYQEINKIMFEGELETFALSEGGTA